MIVKHRDVVREQLLILSALAVARKKECRVEVIK
jgi:hypothetical protein